MSDENQQLFEDQLLDWEIDPMVDLGLPEYIVKACEVVAQKPIKKAEEVGENVPLQKMLNWPNEATITQAALQAMDLHPSYAEAVQTEDIKKEFLEEMTKAIWDNTCEELSEEGLLKIEQEVEIAYITNEITKVIKLEQYYTSLKPMGELSWQKASLELKELVEDQALIYITENPSLLVAIDNPTKRRELPDWVRGIIISKAIQGSSGSRETLNPATRIKPEAQAFREAAVWSLGTHLTIGGKAQVPRRHH